MKKTMNLFDIRNEEKIYSLVNAVDCSPLKTIKVFKRIESPDKENEISKNLTVPTVLSPIFTTTHNSISNEILLSPSLTTERTLRADFDSFRCDNNENHESSFKFTFFNKEKLSPKFGKKVVLSGEKDEKDLKFRRNTKNKTNSTSKIWEKKLRELGLDYPINKIIERSKTPQKRTRVDPKTLKKKYGRNGIINKSHSKEKEVSFLQKTSKKKEVDKKIDSKSITPNKKLKKNIVEPLKLEVIRDHSRNQYTGRSEYTDTRSFQFTDRSIDSFNFSQETRIKTSMLNSSEIRVEKYVFRPDSPCKNMNTLSSISPGRVVSSVSIENSFKYSIVN